MNLEQALKNFNLSQLNSIQLVVLEAAVAALVRTHPNAAALRRDFDLFYSQMQVQAAISPGEGEAMSVVAAHLRDMLSKEQPEPLGKNNMRFFHHSSSFHNDARQARSMLAGR